jgi:hypothetical protein
MADFLEAAESTVVEATCPSHRTVAGFVDVSSVYPALWPPSEKLLVVGVPREPPV